MAAHDEIGEVESAVKGGQILTFVAGVVLVDCLSTPGVEGLEDADRFFHFSLAEAALFQDQLSRIAGYRGADLH